MAKSAQAKEKNQLGLDLYTTWDLDRAIAVFKEAITAAPKNPEYRLNLVRAYARNGNYDEAMQALGEYLSIETEQDIASRYERMFSSALDEVETLMIATMQKLEMPIQQVGKGIQMWLEYRITVGRRPLRIPKPALWAAAITYAICKINFVNISRQQIADAYEITPRALKEKFEELVDTLDIMPADYRYFVGEDNPLDKLIEASRLLENLDEEFHAD